MRTRLDEIILEEIGQPSMGYFNEIRDNQVARIAERAFRHGVEQAKDGMVTTQCWPETVQPAPAEERRPMPIEYDPARACPAHAAGMSQSVPCWPDRRKGERRKGRERHAQAEESLGGILVPRHLYSRPGEAFVWYEERRSGKDRRRG